MNSIFKDPFNDLLSKHRTFIMGCAMIAIMLFHQPFFHDNLFVMGFHFFGLWGVDLFLMISGFGIVYSLKKNSVKQYYINRINRLVPACLFVGLCKWGLMQIGFEYISIFKFNFILIVSSLSLWYIYAVLFYYTLAPILYKLILRYKYWILLGACIFTYCLSYIHWGASQSYLVSRLGWIIERFPAFVFGMCIALFPIKKLNVKRMFWWGIIPLLVCMTLRVTHIPGHGRVIYLILLLALPMLCILAVLFEQLLKKVKINRAVEYIGTISLELYLWHEFIFLNLHSNAMFTDLSIWVKFIIAFGASILLAHFTHILIQRVPRLLE